MRKKARNEFEKDLFKLMNNSIFGKTMQSKRLTLKAVSLENKIIKFYKPIYILVKFTLYFILYIGFAVLDISKTLMYDYHYNVMQRHYGEHIKLMYTDTVYHIKTDDFYIDLLENSNLMDRLDTADLLPGHPCYTTALKKVPGFFLTSQRFCAIRAKSYAYKIHSSNTADTVGRENIKAKGVLHHVVKNHMTLEDHIRCLFGEAGHQLMTIKTNKLTYNSYDNKRVVVDDKINTLAHGNYSVEKDEPEFWPELDFLLALEGQPWTDFDKDFARTLLRLTMEYTYTFVYF
ncbi:Uncharacterized protein FWK35_00011969, partial [Aphis craccivora]